MTLRSLLRFLGILVFAGAAGLARAGAGDLDLTFGNGGKYSPPPECCGRAGGSAIAVQPDGKVLLAGFASNGSVNQAVVMRLGSNGSLDTSFGVGGITRVDMGDRPADVRSLVVRPDGRIVAGGQFSIPMAGQEHSFLFQLDASGTLDASFGRWGVTDVGPLLPGSSRTSLRRLVVQGDGRIVAAGGLVVDGDADMFVARFDASGRLDPSFGAAGVTVSELPDADEGRDAVLAPDGSIVIVGTVAIAGVKHGAAMRVLASGQLDPSFDGDGVKSPATPAATELFAVMRAADGSLLLGGKQGNAAATFRMAASGELDGTYGGSGYRIYPPTPFSSAQVSRILPANATGQAMLLVEHINYATHVHRIDADGALDAGWSASSHVQADMRDGRGADLAVHNGIAFTGLTVIGFGDDIVIAYRFLPSGGVDFSYFGRHNPGLRTPTGDLPFVGVSGNGAIVFSRTIYQRTHTQVMRLTPAGREDASFGSGGQVLLSTSTLKDAKATPPPPPPNEVIGAIGIRADGRVLIGSNKGNIVQLAADGTVDSAFVHPDLAGLPVFISPLADERFLAGSAARLGRFLADGRPDPSFNAGQPLAPSEAWIDASPTADGGLLAAAKAGAHGVIEKRDLGGALDSSFGVNGRVTLTIGANTALARVRVQPDGRIVVAGTAIDSFSSRTAFAARLLPNGVFDSAFGEGGVARAPAFAALPKVYGMALDDAGNVLLAGTEGSEATAFHGFVIKLLPSGLIDGAFGQGGVKIVDVGGGSEAVKDIGLQPDGGIVLVGSANGVPTVYRLFGTASGPGSAAPALVAAYYRSILGREPDAGGQSFWEGELARVSALGAAPGETFYVMSTLFFSRPEYIGRDTSDTQYVADLYRTFFNRTPDFAGLNFWRDQLAGGRPRAAVLNEFLFSAEFASFVAALFGPGTSRAEVSMAMDFYRGLLHRLPDSAGMDFWIRRLRAAQCNGTVVSEADAISRLFLESDEYALQQGLLPTPAARNEAFVLDLYSGFMRRGAESAGLRHYAAQLDEGALTREQLRTQFVHSAEFNQRVNAVMAQGCQP